MAKSTTEPEHEITSLNIYQKIARIGGEIGVVAKDGRNNDQKYNFIEYAAVGGKLRDLFAKYGVVIVPSMPKTSEQTRKSVTTKSGNQGQYVLIDFTFSIVNADDPTDRFDVGWTGEAIDYADKATNKAATAALKYYMMRQFNITERGQDPDAESPEIVTTAPRPAGPRPSDNPMRDISNLLELAGIDDPAHKRAIVMKLARVQDMTHLTRNLSQKVLDELKTYKDLNALPQLVPAPEPDDPPASEPDLVDEYATHTAQEESAADAVEPAHVWQLPDFRPSASGMVQPAQTKILSTWLKHYETVRPDHAKTFVNMLIGKDRPGTYDEAMTVLNTLAEELNALEQV